MWECKIAPPVITFKIDKKTVFIMLLTKISIILRPMEVYCKNSRDIQKGNCCFIKSKFEYLSTMNLYLLISAKKQTFAYFQYLVCLNKVLQSLHFHIPCRVKVISLTQVTTFSPTKILTQFYLTQTILCTLIMFL